MRNGERITSRQVAYVLEKFAERQGVRTKSTHKMRKTYASNLNANGVPMDCIREMLGHSNLSTALEYIYNPLTEKAHKIKEECTLSSTCLQRKTIEHSERRQHRMNQEGMKRRTIFHSLLDIFMQLYYNQ